MRTSTRIVGATMLASIAIACGGDASAGLPVGDHLHSLGVAEDGGLLLGLHGGLYRSGDGTMWEPVGLEGQDAMVIAAAHRPMFVAGHNVLARSDDGGETFTDLRPPDLPGLDIHAFTQAAADPAALYAYVVGHGLFASAGAGDTWERRAELGVVPTDTFGLAVVGSSADALVLVGPESGILRSEDGGRNFSQVLGVGAWAVAVDPSEPDRVWALTGAGLTRSEDAGLNWWPVSDLSGMEGQPVTLAVDTAVLWVATEDPRALYRSGDGGTTWVLIAGS